MCYWSSIQNPNRIPLSKRLLEFSLRQVRVPVWSDFWKVILLHTSTLRILEIEEVGIGSLKICKRTGCSTIRTCHFIRRMSRLVPVKELRKRIGYQFLRYSYTLVVFCTYNIKYSTGMFYGINICRYDIICRSVRPFS